MRFQPNDAFVQPLAPQRGRRVGELWSGVPASRPETKYSCLAIP